MKVFLFATTALLFAGLADSHAMLELGGATAGQANINTMKTSLKTFLVHNGRLPTVEEGLQALVTKPQGAELPKWKRILDEVPLDPWERPFRYVVPGPNGEPCGIYSMGPDGISHSNGNDPDDENSWDQGKRERLRAESKRTVGISALLITVAAAASYFLFRRKLPSAHTAP